MLSKILSSIRKFFPLVLSSLIVTASSDFQTLNHQDEPKFYLSNFNTYSPGDEIIINFNSYKLSDYKIICKLLKITDVENFFIKLNENSRSYNFDIWSRENELLLNYTKLVKEWKTVIQSASYYNNLKIGKVNEPGVYILQVLIKNSVAYCPIVVTDKVIVLKNSASKTIAFLADAESGKIFKDVKFKFYKGKDLVFEGSPDKEGLLFKKNQLNSSEQKTVQIFAVRDDETVVYNPYYYFGQQYVDKIVSYIYTNQPVYRPTQEVNFKAIFRKITENELENMPDKKVSVSIKSPKNKEVYSGELTTNEFGTLSDKFILDEEADLGNYSIILSLDEREYYGSFSVEEYKKPEYKVNINLDKNQFSAGDEIKGTVSADYYFGSPVQNAQVEVNIYRETFWRPWWYFSEYRWFYRSFEKWNPYYRMNKELIQQLTGELGEDGKYHFSYPIEEKIDQDFRYSIIAIVTDASRRATEGATDFFVTRGAFSISTSPEKYFFEKGSKVRIRVNTFNFSDLPVKTEFKIIVTYPDDKLMRPGNLTDTISGNTNERGNALVEFMPKWNISGYYKYSVIAYDDKGREISASGSFFIGDYRNYYYNRTSSGIEIVTDKDAYDNGEIFSAIVFVPFENQELLLTYEGDDIIDYKKVNVENNSFQIKEKLTDKFSPSFNITINFIRNRTLYTTTKLVGVLPKEKFLNIDLTSSKEKYKPGEKASYKIFVKDNKGNPVRNAELSFGIVDESIYAIKEDQTQPIENFFYSPRSSYIPIYNSLQSNRFNTRSRTSTYLEMNYFESELDKTPDEPKSLKSFKLYGNVTLGESSEKFNDYKISLVGTKRKFESEIDSSGNYFFKDIVEGKYQVYLLRKSGGMRLIDIINLTSDKQFDIKLNAAELDEMNEVIVIGEWPMIEKMTTNSKAIFGMEEVVNDRSFSPGIDLTNEENKTDFVPAEIRSNFVDALIWKAHLVTDSEGRAVVEFKVPDNLTTWRTTLKGITKKTEVGQKVHKFISRKDLLVRMETPRFFRQDDEVVISTTVHNYLSTAKRTKIEFSSDKLLLMESKINSKWYGSNFSKRNNYDIEIPANSELRIDWKCKVNFPTGEAVLSAQALTDEESDALELKVPIIPNGVKVVNPLAANFSESVFDETIEFNIPDDIDLRTARFSFSVNPSLAGTILRALDVLAGYPYGCVEQTMSRFLPTIIVANTFKEISVPLKSKTIDELPKYIEAGLKRLYNFQHSDGGWGWWTNDNTNPFMTAYVIYGLTLAKQAGYDIDENIYEQGLKNLRKQIEFANSNIDETTLAYMLYALSYALKDYDFQKKMYYQTIDVLLKKDLNSYSLALLTLTLNNFVEKSKALQLSDRLLKMVKEESVFAFWEGESWHYRWQNDNVQGTAFAVKAIVNVKGNSEIIEKAIKWLLKKRQGFSWRSTQGTANIVFALTDYLKLTSELNPDYGLKIFVNDREVLSKQFSDNDIYSENPTIKIDADKDNLLKFGKNKIRIVKNGIGKVYFSGLTEYFTTDINSLEKENGFKISREYYLLEPHEMNGRIIYKKEKFDGKITSGKELFVKTIVETKTTDMEYFILEDMLPSGFEVVKDIDRYAIEGENNYPVYDNWDYRTWRWHYADREYRDEKVAFFVTSCNNLMEFSYIIKAQIPGEYKIMPAQGYLMYYPELNGFSDVVKVKVEDF